MARIAGVDLPRNKRVNIGLTYIYGIGHSRASRILDSAKVDPMKKVQDLGEDEVNPLGRTVQQLRQRSTKPEHALARAPDGGPLVGDIGDGAGRSHGGVHLERPFVRRGNSPGGASESGRDVTA